MITAERRAEIDKTLKHGDAFSYTHSMVIELLAEIDELNAGWRDCDVRFRNAKAEIDRLTLALGYAVSIIESYEADMRSVVIEGQSLADRGICQGSIYRDAVAHIQRLRERDAREGAG